MFEKTLNVNKENRLLRTFSAFLVVSSLLLVLVLPLTAYAKWGEPVDYSDLDFKVQYGEGYNTVTFPLPADNYVLKAWNTTKDLEVSNYGQSEIVFGAQSEYYDNFKIYIYPASTFGLSLSNIPVGAKIHMQVQIENLSEAGYTMPDWYLRYWYANDNAAQLLNGTDLMGEQVLSGTYNLDYVIQSVPGATRFVPSVLFNDFRPMADNAKYRIKLVSASIEMQVATEFWTQFQNQQNGEMLGEINDKLDSLPEDIGDQMQGVIDKEKDEENKSGNKFVNQILDKLPDPSTDVLDALKKLTDATAYTGTDAKLKIPAIVLPAIDGVFPETVIWEGADFSFSDYLSYIPSTLLTVVQSLFTIAIVLYCVYELKGIISYCLTLNDKKVG